MVNIYKSMSTNQLKKILIKKGFKVYKLKNKSLYKDYKSLIFTSVVSLFLISIFFSLPLSSKLIVDKFEKSAVVENYSKKYLEKVLSGETLITENSVDDGLDPRHLVEDIEFKKGPSKSVRIEASTLNQMFLDKNYTLEVVRIENIVKKYSDHIAFPIYLNYTEKKDDKEELVVDQVNSASAFWKRNKASLKKKDYNEFYKTFANDNEDPMFYVHVNAEGNLEYTTLFYIPSNAPFDMFNADYKSGVKLYVNRVFITDDDKELMPVYLRFVKGIIDSEDLPLNVSREILQQNKILAKIKSNSVKKILQSFTNLAKKDEKKYEEFYLKFGVPIKEGLYQDFENRDTLLELVRFRTNKTDKYISLEEYSKNMKKDQKSIFYITGDNFEVLKNSPLLETCNNKDIEVLIMDNEIDEFVFSSVTKYKELNFKSVNHADALDELKSEDEKKEEKEKTTPLIKKMKKVLGDKVKDVVISSRLTDSPSCIVSDSSDPSAQMQKIFQQMGQAGGMPEAKPILEINSNHKIVKKLGKMSKTKLFNDTVLLLYDQALLAENVKLNNPNEFINRLNRALEKSL